MDKIDNLQPKKGINFLVSQITVQILKFKKIMFLENLKFIKKN